MKSFNILATYIIISCLLVLPGISSEAATPSSDKLFSTKTDNLSLFFKVAAAKEPIYFILIEKNLQRLQVLEYDNELKVVDQYFSATGENFGIKEIKGDSKTPEGVYFITRIFRDDEITIFGDKAFHLDYPNFFDRKEGRNGDGIYIHGTNKELLANSTNGCITLVNNDLDNLEKYLNQVVTPVIIVPEITSIKTRTDLLTQNDFQLAKSLLLVEGINPENIEYNYLYLISFGEQTVAVSDFVYRPFNRSIMRGASRTYLQYSLAQGWTAGKRIWRASPLQIYPEAPVKIAAHPFMTDEVQLTEQTSQDTAALVAALSSPTAPEKDIIVEPVSQIIEKPQVEKIIEKPQVEKPVLPEITVPKITKPPAVQSSQIRSPAKIDEKKITQQQKLLVQTPAAIRDKQPIIDFVDNWKQAWISQEIEPYIAFYDDSFQSGDKNLAEWKEYKTKLNKSYDYIAVDISEITIRWTNTGATVSFKQEYRSNLYSATGIKTLYLIFNDPGWKIMRETFSRM